MIQVGESWYDMMTTPGSILSRVFGAAPEAIDEAAVQRVLKHSLLYERGDTVFYDEDNVLDWVHLKDVTELPENSSRFLLSELARLRGFIHCCLARSGVNVVELPMRTNPYEAFEYGPHTKKPWRSW